MAYGPYESEDLYNSYVIVTIDEPRYLYTPYVYLTIVYNIIVYVLQTDNVFKNQ